MRGAYLDDQTFKEVTTLSAKADSFLGNEAFLVGSHRHRPCLESAVQNIPGRVLVSMQGQTAIRADVLTDREALADRLSATRTLLRSAPRIHFHHCDTGAFGLVSQDHEEAAPGGIHDCPAEPVVPDHPSDVQAFHRDQAVATDQVQSGLVMMIAPLVGDVGMKNADNLDGLAMIRSALLLSTDGTLCTTQGREFLFEKARILDNLTVRGGQEVFKTHVDANGGQDARFYLYVTDVAGQNNEPLAAFALKRGRLDNAFNGAVDLTANHSYVLNAKPVVVESDSVSVGRELDAVESVPRLETRVAWNLSRLRAAEESDERFVESAHRCLSRREVEPREVGVVAAKVFELGRLVDVSNAAPVYLVLGSSLFKAEVVKSPVRFEGNAEFTLLVGIREEAELEGTAHLLFLLTAYPGDFGCNGSRWPTKRSNQ